jgi:NAD(P)-dependent dehydrogenase (short-subunit alcohol dehydrogenase family)
LLYRILNHATQQANTDITTLSSQQWHNVFDTNIHSFFYLSKLAVPILPPGSSIVYNASINMAVGHPELLDYTATKGKHQSPPVLSFTKNTRVQVQWLLSCVASRTRSSARKESGSTVSVHLSV